MTREISESCLARKLRAVNRVVSALVDDALRPHGLRNTQLTLLVAIERMGGRATPTELGRELHLEKSTLSRNLARLEQAGWIDSQPDGRSVRLALAPAGAEIVKEAFPAWRRVQRQLTDWAEPDGVKALESLVRNLPEGSSTG